MKRKAVISVVLAGVLWGVISVFIRKLSEAGFDSLQISLVRLGIAAVVFCGFLAVKDPGRFKIRIRDVWMFVGTGIVSVTLFNVLYFYAMINSQASVAVVLLYTSPVWIMLMSLVLFKEKITGRKVAALVLTIAGCVCVTGLLGGDAGAAGTVNEAGKVGAIEGLGIAPLALLAGIGSGIFYALYTIFGKYALEKYDSMTVTAYTFLFGTVGSIPLGKFGKTVEIVKADPTVIVWCVGIAVVSTVMPYLLYTWGLKYLDSGQAGILVAVEPLVGAVLGMVCYGESHGVVKIAGIAMILAAIVVLSGRKG